MTEQDERTPGTTDDASGTAAADAAVDASAIAAADGSESDQSGEDELTRLRRTNAQLLSEKTRAEAARAENEELKRKLAQQQAAGREQPTTDPGADNLRALRRQLDDDLARYQAWAASDDANTAAQGRHNLRQHQLAEAQYREMELVHALRKVPADLRDDVEDMIRSGEVRSIERATRIAKLERAEADRSKQKGDSDEQTETKRLIRDNEPQTVRRGLTGREGQARQMKQSDYTAELARLRAEGDRDGMQDLISRRNARKIVVVPG